MGCAPSATAEVPAAPSPCKRQRLQCDLVPPTPNIASPDAYSPPPLASATKSYPEGLASRMLREQCSSREQCAPNVVLNEVNNTTPPLSARIDSQNAAVQAQPKSFPVSHPEKPQPTSAQVAMLGAIVSRLEKAIRPSAPTSTIDFRGESIESLLDRLELLASERSELSAQKVTREEVIACDRNSCGCAEGAIRMDPVEWLATLPPERRQVEESWRARLSSELQFQVLRMKQTEEINTGSWVRSNQHAPVVSCELLRLRARRFPVWQANTTSTMRTGSTCALAASCPSTTRHTSLKADMAGRRLPKIYLGRSSVTASARLRSRAQNAAATSGTCLNRAVTPNLTMSGTAPTRFRCASCRARVREQPWEHRLLSSELCFPVFPHPHDRALLCSGRAWGART